MMSLGWETVIFQRYVSPNPGSKSNLEYITCQYLILLDVCCSSFLIIWSAATLNFFIPKITPRNPLREKLMEQASRSGYIPPGFEEMVQSYEKKFGLDQPVWQQYLTYMGDMAHFNLGYSISDFPKTVGELIGQAIWWTVGLLSVTTIITFVLGTLIGALMAWSRSNFFFRHIMPGLLLFSAMPAFIVGLLLIYFVAFKWQGSCRWAVPLARRSCQS